MGTNTLFRHESLCHKKVHPILFLFKVINKVIVINKEKKKQKKKDVHHNHYFFLTIIFTLLI